MNAARWSAVVFAVVVAIVWIVLARRSSTEPAAGAAPDVRVAIAKAGTLAEHVVAQGRVGAPAESASSLAFAVPGVIANIDVRVGEKVAAGQPLAELDATPYVNAAAQAQGEALSAAAGYGGGGVPQAAVTGARSKLEASITQDDARIASDRRALDRERALYAAGVAARKDVDAASAALTVDMAQASADRGAATAELRSAIAQTGVLRGNQLRSDAALAQARRNLDSTTLRARSSGVVIALLRHQGEAVDSTVPVITIGPGSAAEASLTVPGSDARKIKTGDAVTLSISRSRETSSGVVTAVVPAVDPATQASTVVVSGVPRDALAGDAVSASIVTGTVHAVIVPTSALVQDPQSDAVYVFVRSTAPDGRTTFASRSVTVRASDADLTAIASGLRDGETVASQGAFELLAP